MRSWPALLLALAFAGAAPSARAVPEPAPAVAPTKLSAWPVKKRPFLQRPASVGLVAALFLLLMGGAAAHHTHGDKQVKSRRG